MHEPAILFYFWIAGHSDEQPEACFPAVFEFSVGDRARVDKGVIKVFLAARYITPEVQSEGLFFRLTPASESWYQQHSA
jgi:hypothetical protein